MVRVSVNVNVKLLTSLYNNRLLVLKSSIHQEGYFGSFSSMFTFTLDSSPKQGTITANTPNIKEVCNINSTTPAYCPSAELYPSRSATPYFAPKIGGSILFPRVQSLLPSKLMALHSPSMDSLVMKISGQRSTPKIRFSKTRSGLDWSPVSTPRSYGTINHPLMVNSTLAPFLSKMTLSCCLA
jgi:hypothetical protein